MIRQVNKIEVDLAALNVSGSVPPHIIAAAGEEVRWVAPATGVLDLVLCVIAVAGGGNGTAWFQGLKAVTRGITGAVSAVDLTNEVTVQSTAGGALVAGTLVKLIGNGTIVPIGHIMALEETEAGTEGTPDVSYNIVQVIFRANDHLDGQRHPGV